MKYASFKSYVDSYRAQEKIEKRDNYLDGEIIKCIAFGLNDEWQNVFVYKEQVSSG